MRALESITLTGHVIYNPAYTYKFQLKTTQDPDDPMLVRIDDTEFERLEKKFFPLVRQVENLYKSQPRCPGYPKWYSELCDRYHPAYLPNPIDVGTGKTIVPKVFTT